MISVYEHTEDSTTTITNSEIPDESDSCSIVSNEPPRKKKRGLNKLSGTYRINK